MTHGFATVGAISLPTHTAASDEWVLDAITWGDIDAHPTADHFVRLLRSLGAADNAQLATSACDRMFLGNSIRSLPVTENPPTTATS